MNFPPADSPGRLPGVAPRRTVLSALALGALAVPALAACAPQDSLAQQASAGDNKNYIAGDGSVTEYAKGNRSEPVEFKATTYDGVAVTASDWRGKPGLLNVWYAACAPCRAEAPTLVKMADEFGDKVNFLGINVRDEKATAQAFERNFKIPYPSVPDSDGSVLLALSKFVPPQAVPSTIILDKEGRVSARVIGLAQESVLRTLLQTVVDEG